MHEFLPISNIDHALIKEAREQVELFKKSALKIKDIDAIVSPTLSSLKPREGIALDIYRSLDKRYWEFCRCSKLLNTSEVLFYGGSTPNILHVVPPSFTKSEKDPLSLENAYWNLLECAKEHLILSLAFPPLERKREEYPSYLAVPIAFKTIAKWLLMNAEYPLSILFCVEDEKEYAYYRKFYNKFMNH
ncbi:MAG TPA: hypothetical protein DCZ41_03310 [Firmicutes bacterium]|nr:hypothetical protein [Bacillota bacterium]